GELLLGAEVGEPVPGVHALDADHDVGPEGGDGFEESLGPSGDVLVQDDGAGRVEDAQVHGPGVQVDAAVESVLVGVDADGHGLHGVGGPEPAAWSEGAPFRKSPRWDKAPP